MEEATRPVAGEHETARDTAASEGIVGLTEAEAEEYLADSEPQESDI
jgi:hypothetical protein